MSFRCLALFLLAAALARAQNAPATPAPAETILTSPELWQQGPLAYSPDFFKAAQFRWTSAAQDCLRSASPDVQFLQLPAAETLIWLKEKRPAEIILSLYNRGDSAPLDEDRFRDLLQTAARRLAGFAGAAPADTAPALARGFPPKRQTWNLRDLALVMEWDHSLKTQAGPSNFQPEFLRVRILPQDQVGLAGRDRQVSAFALAQKTVTRTPAGDAYLADVPMIDQGPKGYCAVAATERVLRYYGAAFDQHQLAKIAETDAGTDPVSLAKALQRASTQLRISVAILEEFNVPTFLQLVKTYNTHARRARQPEIVLPASGVIHIAEVYRGMDIGFLTEARTRNPAAMNKFFDRVSQHINGRTPLVWGVMLGLIPEPNLAQAWGGHLRLIIGYNPQTREILYSDSWGAGHELKRMPLAHAYTITTSLFAIKPR